MTETQAGALMPDRADAPVLPALEARALCLGYGQVPVVHDLDLEVHAGEVVTVLGANGAGKTTTMLGLAGLLKPLSGDVLLHGSVETRSRGRRARDGLAFVPAGRSIITALSCGDNLRLGRGSVEDALEMVPELRRLLGRRAGLLSGGEQQMLAVARALASRPRVFIADEMSLGLAPKIVDRLLEMLRQAASDGVAVLLVEQHARKALRACNRAYVMKRGRIVLDGAAGDMLRRLPEIESSYLSSDAADR